MRNEQVNIMWEYGVQNWCYKEREENVEEYTDSLKNEWVYLPLFGKSDRPTRVVIR